MLRSLRRVVQRAGGGGARAAAPRRAAARALATHVLNVPAMGDSITEGSKSTPGNNYPSQLNRLLCGGVQCDPLQAAQPP